MSENSDDLVPLTPSMFLIENRNFSTGDIDLVEIQSFRKKIKFIAKLLKDLRLRFRKKYLSLLIQKQGRNKNVREPQIGEVVLIGDDSKKRLNWPLAIIMEVLSGRDGKVRTVKVKTQFGVTTRPVQRIYPLELSVNQVDSLKHEMINIGFAIGNGYLDVRNLTNSIVFFAYYHGLVGNTLWASLSKYCCGGFGAIETCNFDDSSSVECQKAVSDKYM
ncbi:hypothetical protein AVEN_89888-1 [Araneus ventricosus]|uniref:DUF5641 domain-containing protein n=1 Tax=Araneus ventricosus TaxID=182803 RepID=A0A4Y2ELB2_ARAVE|nr:hypothetical protein AVEN_89888-1 [Araneus ventricosus]